MTDSIVFSADRDVESFTDRELAAARDAAGTTWVRAHDADAETLTAVAAAFDIHPLTVEDVCNNVRPKTEEFPAYRFVLLKAAELIKDDSTFDEEVRDEPVGVFVGDDWVVTLSTAAIPSVDRVWRAVERGDERLLERGPDFTAYRVIDLVVDDYFALLDRVEAAIERVEEEVLTSTGIETLERINNVRRDLLAFRKVAWPAHEAVGVLARSDPDQVVPETEKYYRDVYDHLVQVVDLTETYRDLTAGVRDIYLNTLPQSTNEVMKILTVVATIFLPLTFIAGIYGMNFTDSPYKMPELGWAFGYPAALGGMTLVAVIMLGYFYLMGYL